MSPERVRVCVADWEIECCAPPPVIGEVTEWMLEFAAAPEPPDPLLDEEQLWSVSVEDRVVRLDRGPVVAYWSFGAPDPPRSGPVRLTGRLHGTVHGGISPDGFPACRARVDRIRLLSQEYREIRARYWEAVPGTITAVDVDESPKWFGNDVTVAGPSPFGLLLDLAVDPRLPRPAGG